MPQRPAYLPPLPRRRDFIRIAAGVTAGAALLRNAVAQPGYPDKPIRMVVPFATGGGTDVLGRLLGQRLAAQFGQPMIVDNRAGAGGTVGAAQVAQSAPDGHTLLFTSLAPVTIAPNLPGLKPAYDAQKDLLPVAMVAQQPVVIVVNAKLPVRNLRELVSLAKSRPGSLSYATPGIGTELHLIGEMLKLAAGIDILHVPYRGGGPAITDLIGGAVDLMPVVTSSIMPHLRSGAVRALATTHHERLPGLPDVPTAAESGYPRVVATPSWGLFAPAKTSADIAAAVERALRQVERDADYRQRLAELGAVSNLLDPAAFASHLAKETVEWKQVIVQGRLRAE